MYDKIKKLVANSEVSLLNEQIWQQHKTILFLEERVIAFERMMQGYTKVTMDLAKELRMGVDITSRVALMRKTKKGRLGRSPEEVAKRWAEWKSLEESGMNTFQIASRWGVDRGTVDYARSKGYAVTPYKKKSCIPASLIGHTLVALPPTRKGPRRQKDLLRMVA